MGLGYVTSRDFVSFLRNATADDAGNPNPAAGIDTALCAGISSSGMFYRDYLYQGFNADEKNRRVCDAVHIHIPGVQKLFLNYRFAQPNPFTVQHRERYVPDTNFPRHYGVERDPLTGKLDGILKRPATDPKVIHTDTSTEWWQFRSSLVDTDEDGTYDLDRRDGRTWTSIVANLPKDGSVKGRPIQPYFDFMVRTYRELMGWEPETGRPLPQTLKSLGLEELIEKF